MTSTPPDASAVRLNGRLICASAHELDLVRRLLPEHVRLTRAEPGCLSFEVVQSQDPMIWQVDERFTDMAAFKAHQARSRLSQWGRETAAIAREYRIHSD